MPKQPPIIAPIILIPPSRNLKKSAMVKLSSNRTEKSLADKMPSGKIAIKISYGKLELSFFLFAKMNARKNAKIMAQVIMIPYQ